MPPRLPTTINDLRASLAAGERAFPGLALPEADAVELALAGCDLRGGQFRAIRLGHADLRGSQLAGACFQQALLWGADMRQLRAHGSSWQEADLSGARLQGAEFNRAALHRCCLRGVAAAGSARRGWWRRISARARINPPTSAAPISPTPISALRGFRECGCREPDSWGHAFTAPTCGRRTCAAPT
jgi:hypothetical protein